MDDEQAVVFIMRLASMPSDLIEGIRQSALWSMMQTIAPTLTCDAAVTREAGSV